MRRIFFDILLFLSMFIFPWWLAMALALLGAFYFSSFYEIIFLGLMLDSLYNAAIPRFHHVEFVTTILAMFLYVVIEAIKRRVRFY